MGAEASGPWLSSSVHADTLRCPDASLPSEPYGSCHVYLSGSASSLGHSPQLLGSWEVFCCSPCHTGTWGALGDSLRPHPASPRGPQDLHAVLGCTCKRRMWVPSTADSSSLSGLGQGPLHHQNSAQEPE